PRRCLPAGPSRRPCRSARPWHPPGARPRQVALTILASLALHFGLRLALGPTLGLDDAEQVLFAQQWLWNYRFRAPPLFTWALLATQALTPPTLLVLAALPSPLLAML